MGEREMEREGEEGKRKGKENKTWKEKGRDLMKNKGRRRERRRCGKRRKTRNEIMKDGEKVRKEMRKWYTQTRSNINIFSQLHEK